MVIRILLAAGFLAACAALAPSFARDNGWIAGPHSSVRLHGGGIESDARGPYLRAGIEIRLDPGWKTYWRYPGDAGIPPRFDFAASTNVAEVEVAYPAPQRFASGSVTSIGYMDSVIFPLKVRPAAPGRDARLALALSYAVCMDVCIPVSVSASVPLMGTPLRTFAGGSAAAATPLAHPVDPRITAAEARVPRRASLGATGALAVTDLTLDRTTTPWRAIVAARAPAGADLFVEGPDDRWALPVPTILPAGAEGIRRFAFDLDGLPTGVTPAGATVMLTLVTPDGSAIEVPAPLD